MQCLTVIAMEGHSDSGLYYGPNRSIGQRDHLAICGHHIAQALAGLHWTLDPGSAQAQTQPIRFHMFCTEPTLRPH